MTSYDSPWKEALYQNLRPLLELLFPRLAERIDWSEDYDSLEQELRQFAPEGEVGVRLADALIKVRLLSGDDRILHAEVQAQKRDEFERRAFVYYYRAFDRFGLPAESLVILGDDDPTWRPTTFAGQLDYSKLTFEFQPVKLLDWVERQEELLEHENPMGLFVVAHLEALRTQKDDAERAKVKLDLLVRLAARKLDEEQTCLWYRYLDWFLHLPEDVDAQVYSQASAQTKEKGMPFVTYAERHGRQEGIKEGKNDGKREGLLAGLRSLLRVRFAAQGEALMPIVEAIEEVDKLVELLGAAERASVEEFRTLLPGSSTDTPTT